MNNSKKRVLMLSAVAIILATGVVVSGAVKLPEAKEKDVKIEKNPVVEVTEKVVPEKSILRSGKIVFFTQDGCGYCTLAKDFIDKEFPNLAVEVVNIRSDAGYRKIVETARKKRIRQIATPLILLGDDEYILGWGKDSADRFKKYVENLNK